MSRYWHRRHYRKISPEQILFIVLGLFLLGIANEQTRSMVFSFWYIYVFFGIVAVIIIASKLNHEIKLSKAGIHEIDKMSGDDFEIYLSSLFSKSGYRVEHTGKIGDYGADLIIEKDGIRIAVQAKRYKSHIGPDAIREVYSCLKLRNCTEGLVVTNNYFTKEAKVLADANNIKLWNRDKLVDEILKTNSNNKVEREVYTIISTKPQITPKNNSSSISIDNQQTTSTDQQPASIISQSNNQPLISINNNDNTTQNTKILVPSINNLSNL